MFGFTIAHRQEWAVLLGADVFLRAEFLRCGISILVWNLDFIFPMAEPSVGSV